LPAPQWRDPRFGPYDHERARGIVALRTPSRSQAAGRAGRERRGREFLLVHRLFRSDRTGEIINPVFICFAFPPRWHYDILRALDHFRAVDAPRDRRLAEAIEIVRSTRRGDGRWSLQNRWKGKTYFELERLGAPSHWNTPRALRVLEWRDGGPDAKGVRRVGAGWLDESNTRPGPG
jgi:hypothetical protein